MNDMNWLAIYPELVLLSMALVVSMVDLWVKSPRRTTTYALTQLTLAVVAGMHFAYLDMDAIYAMQGRNGKGKNTPVEIKTDPLL